MKNIDDLYPTKIDNLKEHTIKEIYLKLLTNFKNLTIEKNNLSDNLKKERFSIQELKNENQLLKQTSENEKIKTNFYSNQKNENNIKSDNSLDDPNTNPYSTIYKLKADIEKYRKDLILSQAINNNYKEDYEKIKLQMEKIQKEKDFFEEKIKLTNNILEKEKFNSRSLENEIKNIKLEKENLLIDIEKKDEKEKNKSEYLNKFKELSEKYENNNEATLTRALELKKLNEKLNFELEEKKEKLKILEKEKKDIIQELLFERENLNHMQKSLDEKEENLKNLKKENFENNKKILDYSEQYNINTCEELKKKIEELKIQNNNLIQEKKKIEENLNLQNKKNSEIFENTKNFNEEKISLISEIEKLKFSLEKNELEKIYSVEYKNSKEKELEKIYKEKDLLNNIKNNIQNDYEKLTTQHNFLKEKYEKEIFSKNEEISELLKILQNLKENKKNFHKKNFSNQEELLDLQNKISDMQIKEKEYILDLKDKDNLISEKKISEKNSEENKKFLENQIKEYKIKLDRLTNDNQSYKDEIILLSNKTQEEKNSLLEKIITENQKKIDELSQEIKKLKELNLNINREKDILLNNSFNFKMEINSKQEIIEKIFKENNFLNEEILKLKTYALSIFSDFKMILNRLNTLSNKELNSHFSNNIFKLNTNINCFQQNEATDEEIYEISKESLKIIFKEFENVNEKFIDSNNYINIQLKENKKKTLDLENEINNKKNFDEITKKNSDLVYEINNLYKDIEKYKEQQRNLINELNEIRKSGYNENNIKEKLENDIKNILKEKDEIKFDLVKLEKDKIFMEKNKKNSENFLNMIIKNFPCKIISKILHDNISIREFIKKNETEKKNIEERIIILDQEYKTLEKEKNSKNEDLVKVIKSEKDNLNKLTQEYDKRICK